MNRFRWVKCLIFIVLLLTVGCGRSVEELQRSVPEGAAAYFWKTTFQLDSLEREFLVKNKVKSLYVRFFDVVAEGGDFSPNATINFVESPPDGLEIVPVVFITNSCFASKAIEDQESWLATNIGNRVLQMCESHRIYRPTEVQIDCDWTERTRPAYFRFLGELRSYLSNHGCRLSVTIRLHQLSQPAPAADYGVLMAYNTGDYHQRNNRNPVLDIRDVKPYLKSLSDYELGLCAAYPVYSWPVLYGRSAETGKEESLSFLYGVEPDSMSDLWKPVGGNEWVAIGSRRMMSARGDEDLVRIVPGMRLKIYNAPSFAELTEVESLLAECRRGINSRVIIFDLNSVNLSNFSSNEYQKIFNP